MIRRTTGKMARPILSTAACMIMLLLFYRHSLACQVDEFYLAKEGTLAASTAEKLNEANGYQNKADQDKLLSMIKAGTVLRLKEGVKVRVTERSFEYRMLKISLPDSGIPYWVNDGTLKPIECERIDGEH